MDMAFWTTTWEKTAAASGISDQEEQLAHLQDDVVRNETKIRNENTEGTLSHTVAQLKVNKLDLHAVDDRLGGLLRIATGTLPKLAPQNVVVAWFGEDANLKNGKMQIQSLWIERAENEWCHLDSAKLREAWGWSFHVFCRVMAPLFSLAITRSQG